MDNENLNVEMAMIEITKDQSIGKTVKFIEIEEYGCQMIIGFSDGTYATFSAVDSGYDDPDMRIEPSSLNLLGFGDDALIACGLATQSHLDDLRGQQNSQFDKESEQRELREFLRLSEKFRGGSL